MGPAQAFGQFLVGRCAHQLVLFGSVLAEVASLPTQATRRDATKPRLSQLSGARSNVELSSPVSHGFQRCVEQAATSSSVRTPRSLSSSAVQRCRRQLKLGMPSSMRRRFTAERARPNLHANFLSLILPSNDSSLSLQGWVPGVVSCVTLAALDQIAFLNDSGKNHPA
jgi:hypothetical protein